ncbi:tail fiber protein [Fulvivirgaceae bacterium BMA10]|uniref:Tail fiber protein n=1 Tax=Splendidivirga corallicola TaxID=3051826 RepID=A0ABT8KRK9_9BACT|nr:tail fiber protein [Fulvivirgaceae bacterium BMA10]
MKRLSLLVIVLLVLGAVNYSKAQFVAGANSDQTYTNKKVGIGTNNPQSKLHVQGTTSDSQIMAQFDKIGSGAQNPSIQLASNGTVGLKIGHENYFKSIYFNNSYGSADKMSFKLRSQTKMTILNNGNVGIGSTNPDSKLTVNGKIKSEEVHVIVDVPADYVFDESYNLKDLKEVERYIKSHKHLPDIPSANELKEKGWKVGEMSNLLLQKVEELTLYMIELKKENEDLRKKIEALEIKNSVNGN